MDKKGIEEFIEQHRKKVTESKETLDAVKRRKVEIEEEARQERRVPA